LSSQLGRYEILKELKTGGMGEVLLARRRGPGTFEQLVAIKTIRAELAKAPHVRSMFLDEAAILARLNHPAVAHVHDFGEEGDTLYMVMEYVAGIPFRDLADLGASPAVIAEALATAARGLDAAHEARDISGAPLGLVHRDISPDNLLLGYDGHVKVIDFGIALVKNRQTPVTEVGTLKGKPPYMSPEQVKNESLDRRSDVFSLGVVAWELLTGEPLFTGESIFAIAIAVDAQPIVAPSVALGRPLPPGLDAAVLGALERDPSRRTPTAAKLADALTSVAEAAGGETLAQWAQRALAAPREAHARWLASLAGGGPIAEPPRGRATGVVTALAPTPVDAPPPPESPLGAMSTLEADVTPPSSGRRTMLVVLLLALVVTGMAVFLATRGREVRTIAVADARIADAPVVDARAVVDAVVMELDAAARPVDAGTVDAPRLRVTPPPRDAGTVVVAAPDAAIAKAPPAGIGFVTIRYKPGPYVNISIDGGPPLPGPIFKRKVEAGDHQILFLDPVSGDVLDKQSITVRDGAVTQVVQH
jgi:predicted Ser/Thr protein kinase